MSKSTTPPDLASGIVSRDPGIHSGDLVFAGTRVPVAALIDHLKAGATLDDFLAGYPSVERRQAEGVLEIVLGALDDLPWADSAA